VGVVDAVYGLKHLDSEVFECLSSSAFVADAFDF
jgi:hypothetical protein